MGWLKERRALDGTIGYTAVYRDLQGRERSAGTFSSKRAATEACKQAEAGLKLGRVGDPKRGRQRFRDYVEKEWFPNHVIEQSTREGYRYTLDAHILPEFGAMRMIEILPVHVREWIVKLQTKGVRPGMIRTAKVVLDAVMTTALNDQITHIHAGKGVRTPPVAKKSLRVITAADYEAIHRALPDDTMRLLVETDMESGLRWGELTELRVKDLDPRSGVLTVARAVIELTARDRPEGRRFLVKHYPKDREWRQIKLARHLVDRLQKHITSGALSPDDLLFPFPQPTGPARRRRPAVLPSPATLGRTEPNAQGRTYLHGTLTGYQAGRCRCQHCKDAVAAYRAARRAGGRDSSPSPRTVDTDGHISRSWFRNQIWSKAVKKADIGFRVTPHGLRHAHASWLLAGGADLQVVKERLGHGSISTTERYLHTLPDAGDVALAALDAVRGRRDTGYSPARPDATGGEAAALRGPVAELTNLAASLNSSA
jgi:integrase